MCGIAGIVYFDAADYPNLGTALLSLIQPLESRGPDSCGVALYGCPTDPPAIAVRLSGTSDTAWQAVQDWVNRQLPGLIWVPIAGGWQFTLAVTTAFSPDRFRQDLHQQFPMLHVVSVGQTLQIYKGVGTVNTLAQTYDLRQIAGSHGIGHTRMATESVVDTHHSHPFTTSSDLSLVHNGQISNYYRLRFQLERLGAVLETNNDSEAIAHYIDYQLRQGKSLEAALHHVLNDIDGTYTFLVATGDQVALVRDRLAAKPAVVYESGRLVAIASEYRALLNLPQFDPTATIWEPDAGAIHIWSTKPAPFSLDSQARPLANHL